MAAGESLFTPGSLTTLFVTEAIAMVVFHGTPVGSMLMNAFGLEHAAHIG